MVKITAHDTAKAIVCTRFGAESTMMTVKIPIIAAIAAKILSVGSNSFIFVPKKLHTVSKASMRNITGYLIIPNIGAQSVTINAKAMSGANIAESITFEIGETRETASKVRNVIGRVNVKQASDVNKGITNSPISMEVSQFLLPRRESRLPTYKVPRVAENESCRLKDATEKGF